MVHEISFELKGFILGLKLEGNSIRKIVEKLSDVGKPASKNTVCKVIARNEDERNGVIPLPRKLATQNLPSVRIQALIKKVAKAIHSPNPQSKDRWLRNSRLPLPLLIAL